LRQALTRYADRAADFRAWRQRGRLPAVLRANHREWKCLAAAAAKPVYWLLDAMCQ
jgi:hypothetical protein